MGSSDAGPVALQAKLNAFEHDLDSSVFSKFSALLGVEDITFNDEISDNLVPYFVVSQDLKLSEDVQLFRINGGYGFQKDNFGIFCGVDRTFKIWDQDLVIRSDLKQVNDREDLLVSAGFLLTLPFNLALESWLSIPTASGAEESVTVQASCRSVRFGIS